ncbi:hypothetical protein RIF29_24222 [Crotalaria pallida]|uniref:Cullin family profile domain-containing protein n=1 Tax=Crotalaria pallida TaxID=3830 RepID=A0AAN9I315_CROPI
MNPNNITISLREGTPIVLEGIARVIRIVEEGLENNRFKLFEYNKLYSTITIMATQRQPNNLGGHLFKIYGDTFNDYIDSKVLPSLRDEHGNVKLTELGKKWLEYESITEMLSSLFNYLDTGFIYLNKLPRVKDVALGFFRDLVYKDVQSDSKIALLTLIDKVRKGEDINMTCYKDIIRMFVGMGMGDMSRYREDFEIPMLNATAEYYKSRAAKWLEDYSFVDYIHKVEGGLRLETDLVLQFMHASTKEKIAEMVLHLLLKDHPEQLLKVGILDLVQGEKVEDLCTLYTLYQRIPEGLEHMACIFKQHIMDQGAAFAAQDEEAIENQVLAVREAFLAFFEKRFSGKSCASLLAEFLDNTLKSGENDDAIYGTLEKALNLLPYVSDGDFFVEYCRRKLARRLLFSEESTNDDHEKYIIEKIRHEFGNAVVCRMVQMVADSTLNRDLRMKFQTRLMEDADHYLGFELRASILNSGSWPAFESSDFQPPQEMVRAMQIYKNFYNEQALIHRDRKLTWLHSLGRCTISAIFGSKKYDLDMSTYQYRLLIKEPSTKKIDENDRFKCNSEFRHGASKIKIPSPPITERREILQVVEADRKFAIRSTIMTIMKKKEVVSFNDLFVECGRHLSKFGIKVDRKSMKRQVEDLMERKYIERDKLNKEELRYLPSDETDK